MFCSPDSKVHGANMGPTWVLSAPDGPHVGPMNLAIMVNFADPCGIWKIKIHGYNKDFLLLLFLRF